MANSDAADPQIETDRNQLLLRAGFPESALPKPDFEKRRLGAFDAYVGLQYLAAFGCWRTAGPSASSDPWVRLFISSPRPTIRIEYSSARGSKRSWPPSLGISVTSSSSHRLILQSLSSTDTAVIVSQVAKERIRNSLEKCTWPHQVAFRYD